MESKNLKDLLNNLKYDTKTLDTLIGLLAALKISKASNDVTTFKLEYLKLQSFVDNLPTKLKRYKKVLDNLISANTQIHIAGDKTPLEENKKEKPTKKPAKEPKLTKSHTTKQPRTKTESKSNSTNETSSTKQKPKSQSKSKTEDQSKSKSNPTNQEPNNVQPQAQDFNAADMLNMFTQQFNPNPEQSKEPVKEESKEDTKLNELENLYNTLKSPITVGKLFGLNNEFKDRDLKVAFRKLSKVCHPDSFTSYGQDIIKKCNDCIDKLSKMNEMLMGDHKYTVLAELVNQDLDKLHQSLMESFTKDKETNDLFDRLKKQVKPTKRVSPKIHTPLGVTLSQLFREATIRVNGVPLKLSKDLLFGMQILVNDINYLVVPSNFKEQENITFDGTNTVIKVHKKSITVQDKIITEILIGNKPYSLSKLVKNTMTHNSPSRNQIIIKEAGFVGTNLTLQCADKQTYNQVASAIKFFTANTKTKAKEEVKEVKEPKEAKPTKQTKKSSKTETVSQPLDFTPLEKEEIRKLSSKPRLTIEDTRLILSKISQFPLTILELQDLLSYRQELLESFGKSGALLSSQYPLFNLVSCTVAVFFTNQTPKERLTEEYIGKRLASFNPYHLIRMQSGFNNNHLLIIKALHQKPRTLTDLYALNLMSDSGLRGRIAELKMMGAIKTAYTYNSSNKNYEVTYCLTEEQQIVVNKETANNPSLEQSYNQLLKKANITERAITDFLLKKKFVFEPVFKLWLTKAGLNNKQITELILYLKLKDIIKEYTQSTILNKRNSALVIYQSTISEDDINELYNKIITMFPVQLPFIDFFKKQLEISSKTGNLPDIDLRNNLSEPVYELLCVMIATELDKTNLLADILF